MSKLIYTGVPHGGYGVVGVNERRVTRCSRANRILQKFAKIRKSREPKRTDDHGGGTRDVIATTRHIADTRGTKDTTRDYRVN